jgi:DNA-binding MarR family transcriptional regulator
MLEKALNAAHLISRLERLARSGELVEGLNPAQWDALRYLAQANRFSRTPAALANYLASTRGTVSQTLIALEGKGYVRREPSPRDKRSIELALTQRGERALKRDPLLVLVHDIAQAAGPRTELFVEILQQTLRNALARNRGRAFGICAGCRHFRSHVHPASGSPHHCALLDVQLSDADSRTICIEQEPVAA